MPLTPAERQKLYRERLKEKNPEKFLLQKRRNAERSRRNRKKISDYALPEQEKIRKEWRDRKNKIKNPQPSSSTVSEETNLKKKINHNRRVIYRLKSENLKLIEKNQNMVKVMNSLRRKINRYGNLIKKKDEIILQLKEKNEQETKVATETFVQLTPLSKTEAYIEQNLPKICPEEKNRVKQVLLNHYVLEETVKQGYQNENIENKKVFKNIIKKGEDLIKKYKMKRKMATYLGLKGKIRHSIKNNKKSPIIQAHLKDFFERDDVSRATSGKNEVKTLKKEKRQRRYLLATLSKLYQKYRQEGGNLSFATFKRYRPFYVLSPKVDKRNTCACKRHENLEMKAKVLKSLELIKTADVTELWTNVVCDIKSKECSYGECNKCANKSVDISKDKNYNLDENITWDEWVLKNHEYKLKNDDVTKITKRIDKEKKSGTLKTLLDLFQEELNNAKIHFYNIYHQYKEYRRCIENLDECSVALHVDFSENYACKLSSEIQAMHFGASRQQMTIHTGVLYSSEDSKKSFASLSPSNEHGPEAIWAHLLPVLKWIRQQYPKVNGIHFHSDGPTVQYRQKKNFYYFSKLMNEYGFPFSTWNFFEASHGKGAADGVGSAIKRKLDSFVSYGSDVKDAKSAYELLVSHDSSIKLFYIPEEDILPKESLNLAPVPQTMKLHQIVNNIDTDESVSVRYLSCFCQKNEIPGFCDCFNLQSVTLLKNKAPDKVTILSDIKNTPENMSYFDLEKYGPFDMNHVDPKAKVTLKKTKENVFPQKRKEKTLKRKIVVKEEVPKKKKKKIEKSDTEEEENAYSLHDSSSDGVLCNLEGSDDDFDHNEVEEEKGLETHTTELTKEEMWRLCFKDIVLVRYFQRCSWKYYIGFIEDISVKDEERYFTVRFLKTIKNPSLRFVIPKRKDEDTVPENMIVKKINIQESKGQYYLASRSDKIYFE